MICGAVETFTFSQAPGVLHFFIRCLSSIAVHFRVVFASVSKRVFVLNYSYENVFPLQVLFHANQTHFHIEGTFCMRHKVTWKWHIICLILAGLLPAPSRVFTRLGILSLSTVLFHECVCG